MNRDKPWRVSFYLLLLMLLTVSVIWGCARPAPVPTPVPTPAKPAPTPAVVPSPPPVATPKPTPPPKPVATPKPKPVFEWPKPLAWACLDVGSAGYVVAAALSDVFSREAKVALRVIPSGTDVGRLTLLISKRVHVSMLGAGALFALEGAEEFASIEMGPQPLRIMSGMICSWGVGSPKDANIRTPADLKGKRFAWVAGFPSVNANQTGILAFANLTWKDVVKVEFPSFGAGQRGLIEGTCDGLQVATNSAAMYELASSPRGVYFVPLPHKNTEGWNRFQKLNPAIRPRVITEGPGLSETSTYEGGGYPNPGLICLADLDPELAYQQTKLMVELYDKYSQVKAPGIKDFALKYQFFDWVVPYHEGAIRYYKEIGKWTDAAQKHNDKLIERQKVLNQAWARAMAEAAEKKVKADDYPKFWYGIRAQTLKAAGFEPYWKAPGFVPYD